MTADASYEWPALFAPLVVADEAVHVSIQQRFEEFDAANPWVYDCLVNLARHADSRGRTRVGMKHLVEVIRWEYGQRMNGHDFRLNNDLTSRYARKIAADHPELAHLFELRRLRSA